MSDTQQNEHATRIFGYVAAEKRIAVVLRRGPSKMVEMLRWDLCTDTLERGQWLKGRVYDERCNLSPDGALFVYFAASFVGAIPTYTAISRPPYFTALALWKEVGTWGGGGRFTSPTTVRMNGNYGPPDIGAFPPHYSMGEWSAISKDAPFPRESYPARWLSVDKEFKMSIKAHPVIHGTRLERLADIGYAPGEAFVRYEYSISAGRDSRNLGQLDWAEWDLNGDLLFAKDGCLWREREWRGGEFWKTTSRPVLVADLRPHKFSAKRAPENFKVWPPPRPTR